MSKKKVKVVEKKVDGLDVVRKAIEKKYGAVLTTMGEQGDLIIPTISTGSLGLDSALGRGGFAMGRVYEVFGPPSGGKCVTSDTYLSTEHGLLTIEELFDLNGTPTVTTNKELEAVCGLRNEHGVLEGTSHFVWNNKKVVNLIKSKSGLKIRATDMHKLRVIDKNTGFIVWKKSKDIVKGDYLLINTQKNERKFNDCVSEDEATLLGMLVAEGYMNQQNHFSFTNNDSEMLGLFELLCENVLGFTGVKRYTKTDSQTITARVNSKEVRGLLLDKYDLDLVVARNKKVPKCVRMSSTNTVSKFLSAYFSLDGCYEHKNRITASSASEELLIQVQLLLLDRFGIKSTIRDKNIKGYEQTYYNIGISSEDAYTFIQEIGFILEEKNKKVAALGVDPNSVGIAWNFPHQEDLVNALMCDTEGISRDIWRNTEKVLCRGDNLSKSRINLLLELFSKLEKGTTGSMIIKHFESLRNYACTEVEETLKLDKEPVFDVVMPETHSFISNGLISHNTTLTMSLIAQAQKRGLRCCFVDAERAADPILFKAMGVNVDDLLLIKAFAGDDNLDVLEKVMATGEIDVAIVDSVSALIPKAEADSNMEDQFMGLLARLMSKAMRKFVPLAGETNTLLVFINQVRFKIGSYGDPEVTTGGVALDFTATGRIRVTGGDSKASRIVDTNGEIVGHHTKFKVVKNKLARPFRETMIPLIYGVGYDQYWECLNLAVDVGLIEKSGSWFSYENKQIGQGDVKAMNFLRDNHDVFLVIRDELISILGLKELYESNS